MTTVVPERVAPLLRRLGPHGTVLLAALACDLWVVGSTVLDGHGIPAMYLLLLPGIVAITACGLYGRTHAVRAGLAAAVVLVASTVLIREFDLAAYSVVLRNVSFAETVAGVQLVYVCVRRARAVYAVAVTTALVAACLVAVMFRGVTYTFGAEVSLMFGSVLLMGTLVVALTQRHSKRASGNNRITRLLRGQWPIIGLLSVPLFGEIINATKVGAVALPILLCSIVANVCAVLATRTPARAGIALGITLAVSAVLRHILLPFPPFPSSPVANPDYVLIGGIPFSQVTAGMMTVVLVVRGARAVTARNIVIVLAAIVTVTVLSNIGPYGVSPKGLATRELALGGMLLLGISLAIGLFLRSRDSEHRQTVQAAMSDAQTSERMALARELHDVVAHHVTGIVVQAQAAKMVGTADATATREAFDRIEASGTEALTAMRRLVGSMRDDEDDGHSRASEQASTDLDADLRALAGQVDPAITVEFDIAVPAQLPQEIARSALRLAQEALTNTSKHAVDATLITVSANLGDGDLHVRIADNGSDTHAEPAGGSGGYGLVGMRERVELLGGELTAGRDSGSGWCVQAVLPVEAAT